MSELNADPVREALREALELVEQYALYVDTFLLEKWGHDEDLVRLKAALTDGSGCP